MTRTRITDEDVRREFSKFTREVTLSTGVDPECFSLRLGNAEHKVPNMLIYKRSELASGGTNLWTEVKAGYTKREAYNALRLMTTSLALSSDLL